MSLVAPHCTCESPFGQIVVGRSCPIHGDPMNKRRLEAAEHLRSRHAALRQAMRDHYLAGIECDHDSKQDRPLCACSLLDLGWHPNVGAAVEAWAQHVEQVAAKERTHPSEGERR